MKFYSLLNRDVCYIITNNMRQEISNPQEVTLRHMILMDLFQEICYVLICGHYLQFLCQIVKFGITVIN